MTEDVDELFDYASKSEFNTLKVVHPDGSIIGFRVAQADEIPPIHKLAVHEIGPDIASLEVMQRVYSHDPESLRVVLRAEPHSSEFGVVGCYGYLFFNEEGVARLEAGTLDTRNPDTSILALPDERPAQIYIWMMVARKLTKLISPIVIKSFPRERYAGVPIAARAGTIGGLKSIVRSASTDESRHLKGLGDVFKIDPPTAPSAAEQRQ